MPFYKHYCQSCCEEFFVRLSITEYGQGAKPRCPKCGSVDTRRLSAPSNPRPAFRDGGGCCARGLYD